MSQPRRVDRSEVAGLYQQLGDTAPSQTAIDAKMAKFEKAMDQAYKDGITEKEIFMFCAALHKKGQLKPRREGLISKTDSTIHEILKGDNKPRIGITLGFNIG